MSKSLKSLKLLIIDNTNATSITNEQANEINIIKTLSDTVTQRDAALSRKERIGQEIERLLKEDAEIDKYITGIDKKLEDYGYIRYTEEFLELLIQEEVLKSKRENLIRLKDEVMKGESSVETILGLINLDKRIINFIHSQQEGSRISKLFKSIVRMGGGAID